MGKDSKPKTAKGAGKGDKGGDKAGAKGGDKGQFTDFSFPIIFHFQVSTLHTFFRESTTFISMLSSFNDLFFF